MLKLCLNIKFFLYISWSFSPQNNQNIKTLNRCLCIHILCQTKPNMVSYSNYFAINLMWFNKKLNEFNKNLPSMQPSSQYVFPDSHPVHRQVVVFNVVPPVHSKNMLKLVMYAFVLSLWRDYILKSCIRCNLVMD